jgi:hypothetical protein
MSATKRRPTVLLMSLYKGSYYDELEHDLLKKLRQKAVVQEVLNRDTHEALQRLSPASSSPPPDAIILRDEALTRLQVPKDEDIEEKLQDAIKMMRELEVPE